MPFEQYRGYRNEGRDYPTKADGTEYCSFLSYSTRDDEVRLIKPFVDRYLDGIRDRIKYIPVYYDYFFMPGGHRDLCHALGRAIRASDFTTAFLSPGYDSSPWCGFEWGYTHALNTGTARRELRLRTQSLLSFGSDRSAISAPMVGIPLIGRLISLNKSSPEMSSGRSITHSGERKAFSAN